MLLSAFHKLPEILASDFSSHKYYEAHLANMYAMAVLLELNSNNINYPLSRIKIEASYTNTKKHNCDLYVELLQEGLNHPLHNYGINCHNWIEVKYFAGLARAAANKSKRTEPKVSRVAEIINDIFRLCLYVKEEQGSHRDNGRFILLVFSDDPSKYLSFKRINKSGRLWLKNLLSPGTKEVNIDLAKEVDTIKKGVMRGKCDNSRISLKCDTHMFSPLYRSPKNVTFYGYFINIFSYSLTYKQYKIDYDSHSKKYWSEKKVRELSNLSNEID